MDEDDIVFRLKKRAEIRRKIPRKEPDRISEILEEAACEIESLRLEIKENYRDLYSAQTRNY